MKKIYKRNFVLIFAKIFALIIGIVFWLIAYCHTDFYGTVSIFSVSKVLNFVGRGFGSYLIIITYSIAIIYGGLLIGLSFLRGKARSIMSIVFSVFLINCAIFCGIYLKGFGAYVFMGCCGVIIGISIYDLILLSKEKKYVDNPLGGVTYNGYANEPLTVVNSKRGNLVCVGGEYSTFAFPISEGETITIGKDPSTCSIVITQNTDYVSSVHCCVRINNGKYEIIDKSRNGVQINEQNIPQNVWCQLSEGTVFSLATSFNYFRVD